LGVEFVRAAHSSKEKRATAIPASVSVEFQADLVFYHCQNIKTAQQMRAFTHDGVKFFAPGISSRVTRLEKRTIVLGTCVAAF
jgi:hypothetical protein